MTEHLKIVLSEMCKYVNINIDAVDFTDQHWYSKQEWTIEESKLFKKWLSDYIYNNTAARNELMNFPHKNKKRCNQLAAEFVFMYGWKFKE